MVNSIDCMYSCMNTYECLYVCMSLFDCIYVCMDGWMIVCMLSITQ